MKTESFHDLSQAAPDALKGKPIVVDQPEPGDIVNHPDSFKMKHYSFDQLGPRTFEIMVQLSTKVQTAYQGDLYHDVAQMNEVLRQMENAPVSRTFYWLVRESGTSFWLPNQHPEILDSWSRMVSLKAYRVSWLSEPDNHWTIKFTVIHDTITKIPAWSWNPENVKGIPTVTDQG